MLLPLHSGCQLLKLALTVLWKVWMIKGWGSLLSLSYLRKCNWCFNIKIDDRLSCEGAVSAQDSFFNISYLIDISLDASFIAKMFLWATSGHVSCANDKILRRHTWLKKEIWANFSTPTNSGQTLSSIFIVSWLLRARRIFNRCLTLFNLC